MKQSFAEWVVRRFSFAKGVDVTDDRLRGFVNAEGVALDTTAMQSDKAGKDAAVEVVEQQLNGFFVVPEQACVPTAGFVFEQRTKLRGGKVAQVVDFELWGGRRDFKSRSQSGTGDA